MPPAFQAFQCTIDLVTLQVNHFVSTKEIELGPYRSWQQYDHRIASTVIPARPCRLEGGLKKPRTLTTIVVFSIVYFVAGKLGLSAAYVHPSASAVWPCTGIALTALLILGYEIWPGIFLGAFLVNITTAGSALVCLGIAAGNTLEALAGAYLVTRFAGMDEMRWSARRMSFDSHCSLKHGRHRD